MEKKGVRAKVSGIFRSGVEFNKDVFVPDLDLSFFDSDLAKQFFVDIVNQGGVKTDTDPPGIFALDCDDAVLLIVEPKRNT